MPCKKQLRSTLYIFKETKDSATCGKCIIMKTKDIQQACHICRETDALRQYTLNTAQLF